MALFSRSLLSRPNHAFSSILSRSISSLSPASSVRSSTPSLSSLVHRLRPLAAASVELRLRLAASPSARGFATRSTSSSLNDPNPNWSNRPPKETILLDGCDFEHWLVVMDKPEGDPTRDDIIDSYIKTLAKVLGSEEEARMKIYSVSTRHYFAFGALVPEDVSIKIKELPGVRWVLPDSYLDVKNKDYGGEPFINGQAVPYDPKYHEEWVRNNARANERNRRSDRPRNFDRSRNFERRRENMGGPNQGFQSGPPPNMSGPPQNRGPPPNNPGGAPPQFNQGPPPPPQYNQGPPPPQYNQGPPPPQYNQGGPPPPQFNQGGPPPPQFNQGGAPPQFNQGGAPPQFNQGGAPPQFNQGGGPPQYNRGGAPPQYNQGGAPPQYNQGGAPPQYNQGGPPSQYNQGGAPPPQYNNMGGAPPRDFQNQNYTPSRDGAGVPTGNTST